MKKLKKYVRKLKEYMNKSVIMDSKGDYIFLGILINEDEEYYTLVDVDVHDHRTTTTAKDVYIIESMKYGIKPNRKKVKVLRREIISISLLDDIIPY